MPGDAELNAIEEAAADWMVERDRGLTPARERELGCWLSVDARHAAAFNALAETWTMMSEVSPEKTVPHSVNWSCGAPAAVFNRNAERAPHPHEIFRLTLAAAAAVAVALAGWWQWSRPSGDGAFTPFAMTAMTEVGVLRKVNLPEGSVIQLNTDSAVEIRLEAAERRVRLIRGEAHFTVAKNRERPFIVSAAGVDVRVVGTVFNVRLRSEAVDVLVTEGAVRVGSKTAAEAGSLTAGQKVSIALGAPAISPISFPVDVAAAEIKQTLAWQENRLDFDATPLLDIVKEINRYNRHKLVISDARLNAQRFGGSFPAGDHETFVRMLETNFGVVAERKAEETFLRLKTP